MTELEEDALHPAITYRPIIPADYEELAAIIVKTWKFDQISSDHEAVRSFGLQYLFFCLMDHSFSCVAVQAGHPIAILVGTHLRRARVHPGYVFRSVPHFLRLALSRDFRKNQKEYAKYWRISKQLETDGRASEMEAELALFISDERCRGLGVGLELYRRFLENLRQNDIHSFYVHTDTACTYSFYEHRGLELLASAPSTFSYAGFQKVDVLLYGNRKIRDDSSPSGV